MLQAPAAVRYTGCLFYEKNIFSSKFKGVPNFIKVAEGFGWQTCDLDQADDPGAALREALATPGPMLIHVSIDRHEQVLPMVAPGAANTDMIGD
mgnify:CR=1 FL=1